MEEFVEFMVQTRNSTEKKRKVEQSRAKNCRYREFISKIIASVPEIDIAEGCNKEGDVRFSVKMKDLGVSFDMFVQYKTEIFSDFMANFIGELLVRENINQFAEILTSIDLDEYPTTVNNFEHRQFGLEFTNNKFVFSFHVSLLQSILTENFKKKIK
jgi:hypothetical protein